MKNKTFKFAILPAVFAMLLSACSGGSSHQHVFSDEWVADDEYHWHPAACEHKDVEGNKAPHSYVKGETILPTKEKQGYTVYTCSVCNHSKNADYVDPVDQYEGRIKNKDFKVINISYERQNANDPRFFDEAKPLATYLKQDTYKLYYLDEINDVYYLPLSTFVDLYKGDFKDGVVNKVTEKDGIALWTSQYENNQFSLALDMNKQTITVKGNIEDSFKAVPNGRNGVFDQASIDLSYAEGHQEKAKTYSFAEYGFDTFEADGKLCFPFALIACETSKYIERKFLNVSNKGYLVEYASADQYSDLFYLDEKNQECGFTSLISSSYKELYGAPDERGDKYVNAPASLTEFNKKIIYYLFDNYYGLASTRGIKSMSSYFKNLEVEKSFTSADGTKRGSAYSYALQGLNDLHTSYGYSPFMDENASSEAINDQSCYKDRVNLSSYLGTARDQEIQKYNDAKSLDVKATNVRYSDDGNYAYFSFDIFNSFNYYEQGDIPESELFADAYYQFVMNLNEIKAKGGVKRVIVDDSLNGGGYVAIMGKLLALLSKDNKSLMYLRDEKDNSIQVYTTRVDSNKDGKYDEKDCYGNDFDFYILTSSYSFSCGNAFPFYADKNGYAKVIGMQSGGGECCVFNYTLPTGQSITYSSPFHIGQYNKENDSYEGDEAGTFPYISVSKSFSIYNVNELGAFISIRNPIA